MWLPDEVRSEVCPLLEERAADDPVLIVDTIELELGVVVMRDGEEAAVELVDWSPDVLLDTTPSLAINRARFEIVTGIPTSSHTSWILRETSPSSTTLSVTTWLVPASYAIGAS